VGIIVVLCCASVSVANINIELRPPTTAVAPNAFVNIGLYLVSDNATTQYSIAADVVFSWDSTRLQFLGINNAGGAPVTLSDLPANSTLNETLPPADGDGFYQMLGQFGNPVAATPAGTLLTTFRFKALSTACTGAAFAVLPSGGTPVRFTKVLDGIVPNFVVTGTLGSATVFIDGAPPVINSCAAAQVVPADPACQGVMPDMTGLIVVSDNCSNLQITQTPIAGAVLALGPHAVVIQVMDPGGNIVTCPTSVTVADQSGPGINQCALAQTIAADANCQAMLPDLTGGVVAVDVCSPPVTVTQSPLPGTLVGLGPQTVTLIAADALNNTSTCQVDVTVADQTMPEISVCPNPPAIAADGACQATVPDLTGAVVASDNCTPVPGLVISQVPTAGATIGLGPTQVTISVQDAALNVATCMATVTVTDQTPPALVGCPANLTVNTNAGSCTAVVSWTEPTATDNCGGATVTRTQGPAPGATFAGGSTTTVEYTATDGANLTSVCSFTVTVTPSPDMDDDADVDVDDLPIFVNVLLGVDATPYRVARADVNCDGSVDGLDIQPFADILIP